MSSKLKHSAHVDTFSFDNLPPRDQWPEFTFDLPDLHFPERVNCATELLDNTIDAGFGERPCVLAPGIRWTYTDLLARANQIANLLVDELGMVAGNRVLLRGANSPMMAACWFAVIKAGGIAVATMPLLRAKELTETVNKAKVTLALCEAALAEELTLALPECPTLLKTLYFGAGQSGGLETRMASMPTTFKNVETAADDTCIIAFTSGTTGKSKGTMHFHRDVMAACKCWPISTLRANKDDIFIGSPPLAFTFGLGGLLLFPMCIGASTVLLAKASPESLIEAIEEFHASVCFTAPTSYRVMANLSQHSNISSLRKCVSAGEALPVATRKLWKDTTGIEIIDGIGATEMLHIFISADEGHARPGVTGKPIPGYRACIVDDAGKELPQGTVGKLAVKGPTGCRYLDDSRQQNYVKNGWNLTGDAYLVDNDGYYVYQSRIDDLIISAGYNIAGPEVEGALMMHSDVAECAVVGVPDVERGQIVKAFVVLRSGIVESTTLVSELQVFVKKTIAPYKYPRAIEFRKTLPRTENGKLQRFKLREIT